MPTTTTIIKQPQSSPPKDNTTITSQQPPPTPSPSPNLPQINIDRQWLVKLLQKYPSQYRQPQNNDSLLHNKAFVVAPMVEQSDLPFRLLCRKYGANLAFTPMIHAGYFARKYAYRHKMWMWKKTTPPSPSSSDPLEPPKKGTRRDTEIPLPALPQDRPLIAQLCGNHKDILLQAAQLIEHQVDAIDLNCGCPTQTAKRGGWGAFLLPSGPHLVGIVKHLVQHLSCPVTVKVRILDSTTTTTTTTTTTDHHPNPPYRDSLELYTQLVDAGASMLTIHGRTKSQTNTRTGSADWKFIRTVVQHLGSRIPILANGNIETFQDVRACLHYTGCDGIMSSESILEYPPLFTETEITETAQIPFGDSPRRTGPGRVDIAQEYLDLCQLYPPLEGGGGTGMQCMRMHIDTFLHEDWKQYPELRQALRRTESWEELNHIVDQIRTIHLATHHDKEKECLSWYRRHRSNPEEEENNHEKEERYHNTPPPPPPPPPPPSPK